MRSSRSAMTDSNRADAVDRGGAVSELVGSCLGKQLSARSGARDRVVARPGFRQRREDLFERGKPDLAFPCRRQSELAVAFFDDLVLLELAPELEA